MVSALYAIVGLGNPGKEYELTRHNLGFLVVDQIAQNHKLGIKKGSLKNSLTAQGGILSHEVILLKPTTFVNNSGTAVKELVAHKGIDYSNILIVADDFNLDFGSMRLKADGSDGGHNGLKSIIQHCQTKNFARLRLGIGQPKDKKNTAHYVLSPFVKGEKAKLNDFINQAAECCLIWLSEGINKAMNQFNRRERDG